MSKLQRWIILAIVSSGLFLIVIDMTVLYTALPILTHDLYATASEKLWIVNAYPLVMAGLLPGFGTLGDKYGHKRFFIMGLAIFGLASIIAAFAPSAIILILARVLLAIGAAMMMPATLSLIRITFTDVKERSIAIAIWASVSAGGAGIGPLIGGFLLEHFWWGSVFLINVPIVIIAFILGIFIIPRSIGDKTKLWDFIGSVQIMIALVTLIFAIKESTRQYGSIPLAFVMAIIGLIAMFFFIRRQRTIKYPLLDLSLFKNKKFSTGAITAFIASFALVGADLLFTQRLQLVLGFTPLQAGLFLMSIALSSFIFGTLIGLRLHVLNVIKVQSRTLFMAGIGLIAFILLRDAAIPLQIIALFVFGGAIGAAMTTASNAIMVNAPVEKAGMAASVEEISFELGSAIGVAILGSLSALVYSTTLVVPKTLNTSSIVRDSLDQAIIESEKLSSNQADTLLSFANNAFNTSFVTVITVAILILITGSLLVTFVAKKDK